MAREVIEQCLRTAGTAPSGAHQQPWHFVAVQDQDVKAQVRAAAEVSEKEFYSTAPAEWLDALAPLGSCAESTAVKPCEELAVFAALLQQNKR